MIVSLFATAIGIATGALGVSSRIGSPRRIVPLSGALLMAVALGVVLPELAGSYGAAAGAAMLGGGVALMWAFGRWVYPVCPACSHTHEHEHCATTLHGFALPLAAAASLHAFLDGLGIAASEQQRLASVVVLGVVLHKIPEGIALGIMLRAAVQSRAAALGWVALAESATALGALLESALTVRFGTAWVSYALALAGGSFLYLGFHAVHGTWKAAGLKPAAADPRFRRTG